jgi:tight adherence protein B
MFLTLIFAVVLIICFGVVLFFTRASETEVAVRRRLDTIAEQRNQQRSESRESTILKQERLSATPAVHDFLATIPLAWKLQTLLKQAGTEWMASSILSASLVAAFVGAIVGLIWSGVPSLVALIAIGVGLLPTAYVFFLRHEKLKACDALILQAVELMARALKAGQALNSALEMVGQDIPEPLGAEFRIIHEEQFLGLPLRDAMLNLLERVPTDDMRFLTTALLLQKETGGNVVQILETVASVMRDRVRVRGQVKIYTAQARITAWIISLLPLIMLALFSFLNPGYESALFTDPTGRTVFYVGLGFWATGILLLKQIATIKV